MLHVDRLRAVDSRNRSLKFAGSTLAPKRWQTDSSLPRVCGTSQRPSAADWGNGIYANHRRSLVLAFWGLWRAR